MSDAPTDSSRNNIREQAVALQYQELDDLPRVVATGAGEIARQIVAIAQEHHIPIERDSTLTDLLGKLSVGSTISPESFRLVAELMCFLYHTDLEFKKSHPSLEAVMEPKLPEISQE